MTLFLASLLCFGALDASGFNKRLDGANMIEQKEKVSAVPNYIQ